MKILANVFKIIFTIIKAITYFLLMVILSLMGSDSVLRYETKKNRRESKKMINKTKKIINKHYKNNF